MKQIKWEQKYPNVGGFLSSIIFLKQFRKLPTAAAEAAQEDDEPEDFANVGTSSTNLPQPMSRCGEGIIGYHLTQTHFSQLS